MNEELKPEITPDNSEKQYNEISGQYAALVEVDPSKKYAHFPSALKMLGDIKGKRVLDIGCGNGTLDRMMVKAGAEVIGYDASEEQIANAMKMEVEGSKIQYQIAGPETFKSETKFDKAASVLVLMYARDKIQLQAFFQSAFDNLKEDAPFASVFFNPEYKRLGQELYNRRFSKTEDGRIKVEFFNNQNSETFPAYFSDFSKADYEEAAKAAGFKELEWIKVGIDEEGRKKMGEEFWQGYEEDCPYIGFRVKK